MLDRSFVAGFVLRRLPLSLLVAVAAVLVLPDPAGAQDTSLTPSPADPDVGSRSEAVYTIAFTGAWTTTVTSGGVPGGAHFSRLIGGVHNDEVTFLKSGEEASVGVESMAESGGYTTLKSEITAAGDDHLSILQGTSGSAGPTATVTFSDVTLSTDHPRVTLVTMIAPSPDWFVGVSGLSMLDSSGDWNASVSVDLYPWDAGTEDGTEFSFSNSATNPRGNITSLQDVGKFNSNKIATLTFTRTSVLSAAPTISAVHPGDEALTVVWTAPSGVTGITAYDLRWILTSADDTADSNWTVVEDAWTEGVLRYVLAGLTDDAGYDVEVRAVTDTDGAWSATVAGTPTEPGSTFDTALTLPLDLPLGGDMDVTDDLDIFKFTLTAEIGVLLFSLGDLDTVAVLYDENGALLGSDGGGFRLGGPRNFLIWSTLDAGTYYLRVTTRFFSFDTGPYQVHVKTIADTTGISDAEEVEVGRYENGLIDPGGDEDYFQFTLDAETDVLLRAGPPVTDTVGELLDNNGMSITKNDDGFVLGRSAQFLIRRKLAAGTYYVKVNAFSDEDTGLYSFHVDTVIEPGSAIADAQALDFGETGAGRIDPSTDADYFKIELSEATHVFARAVSNTVDIDGALVDDMGDAVETNLFEQDFGSDGPMGFTLADRLDAGTHYIKVTRSGGESTGGYAIRMLEDGGMNRVVAGCSAFTAPFSDPLSGCQWNLKNTGQLDGTSGQDIRVEEVWTGGNMGAGIGVAVVDNGLHEGHPDLTDNVDIARRHDYSAGGHGLLHPFDSHGTAVAGIIAARDNALGGRGVAPRATIYGYNVLTSDESDIDANEVDAMNRNLDTTGVSNNSWGPIDGPGLDPAPAGWDMAIDTGVTSGYGGKGVVYVWASGNGGSDDNSNFDSYANYYGVVAVCAVDNRGQMSWYSEEGANLWVCAPSDGGTASIFTTYNFGRYGDSFGGTSAAAPTVAGVVALVRAANSALTWRDVKLILAASARKNDTGNSGWRTGASKYGASGTYNFNHKYGFGVVDAKAAVDLVSGWENLLPFIETEPVKVTPNLVIPDATSFNPGATVTSTVTIGTEVEFIEFVEIIADLETPAFRDLEVELVSPSNRVSTLAVPFNGHGDGNTFGIDPDYRFGSARHLGEDPAGTWTLRVTDRVAQNRAILKSWSLKFYGHRSTPGAPDVPVATPGRRALTVFWSAPLTVGASEVTTYDVRYILASASDRADSRWTEERDVWTAGTLTRTVTGLLDGTSYDVQVRGVNAKGRGAWSQSATATTLPNRAPQPVGSLVGPALQVGDASEDVDVSGSFEDPDGDTLTYDASSSAPGIAQARTSGSRVTLTPVAEGTAAITVTATDVAGSNTPARQTFDVRVKGMPGVTISRNALTVDEGSTGTYTVVLDSEPTGPVTVTPSVPANTDLSVDPAELTFTAGDWSSSQTVSVAAATDPDTAADPRVTISHQVSGGDYGSVLAASVLVTIVEADTSTLSVEAAAALESDSMLVFRVTLNRASGSEVTVDYATSSGSGSADARAGSDYTAASGTLTFPVGMTAAQQIVVNLMDDTEDEEEEETFRLTLSNAQHASLAGGGSTLEVAGTIRDDDDPEVEVSFGSANYGVTEGGTVTVVVRLNRDPERDLSIDLERTHHGGAADADYSGVPPSVAFGSGVTTQDFLFAATDDSADDDGEAVVLGFGSLPSRVTAGGVGETTLAIQDNDGGASPGVGGGGGGGGPPPSDDEDDDAGDGGGAGGGGGPPPPSGPPKADFTLTAECAGDLCRARTGLPVTFEDTSTGRAESRRWDFGDGTGSHNRRIAHAWAEPGFYEVTLTVSDGTTTSTAKQVFLVEASDPAGTCVSDAETLCLRDSRYSVAVEWRTADGKSGDGSVVHEGTNDSGLFTFFNLENWEVLIKVLDGCALNGHVWVYGASTTDLGYVIRVTDTATGTVQEYRNEPGLPAPAITDGRAFPACAR